jgi:hypothetical protein
MKGPDKGPRIPNRNVYVIKSADDLPSVLSEYVIYNLQYDPGEGAGFYITLNGTTLTKLTSTQDSAGYPLQLGHAGI